MKKRNRLILTFVCMFILLVAFATVTSAKEFTVTTSDEFNTAYADSVDGDTIIIKSSISATLDFGKSVTYVLDGDGIVWTAGAQNTDT